MENQTENIDKNQLALFTLLTDDQEKAKNDYIRSSKDQALKRYNAKKLIADLLEANGFEGRYLFNAAIEKSTVSLNVAKWGENKIEIEIEVENCLGGVFLVYDKYSTFDKKIITIKNSVEIEKGKLNCYSLQDSMRYIKPKTMLEKIIKTNQAAVRAMNIHNEKRSIIDYTINKYSKLYPNAEISKDSKWIRGWGNKGGETINVVKIKFKSGSHILLGLGYEKDKEHVVEKYNVIKKSLIELLDEYNNQK
jgi:hypothetical protein